MVSTEPAPPTAPLRGKMRWFLHDLRERRHRYSPDALAHIAADALALAVAAGAPDEHRLLLELAAARAALAAGDTDAAQRIVLLAQDLLTAVRQIHADLPDEIYRARAAHLALAQH